MKQGDDSFDSGESEEPSPCLYLSLSLHKLKQYYYTFTQ
jgi:hypothetical protein